MRKTVNHRTSQRLFILLFFTFLLWGCSNEDILGNYNSRNCLLEASNPNSIMKLSFWIDSGGTAVNFRPKKVAKSLNICNILSDSLRIKLSDMALISATFSNGNNGNFTHGEFHLEFGVDTIIQIKETIQ